MAEPRWLTTARKYDGTREVKEANKHNPLIVQWFAKIRAAWFKDDETPWCAAFVGGVLEESCLTSSRSAAARSYLQWGSRLVQPVLGCIVVFERGPKAGHVAFLVGFDEHGNPVCLGGNQGDAVSIKVFPARRVLGYRWPSNEPLPQPRNPIPLMRGGVPSEGEA